MKNGGGRWRSRSKVWLVAAILLAPLTAPAQAWQSASQDAMWVGTFVDQPITAKTSLWFDNSWRSMDFGARPQQVLLRPGVQYTLAPGVRVAAGYAYIATAPYGALPSPNPLREQRTWQQLTLTHKGGPVTFSHRYRLEQRWIRPLLPTVASVTAEEDRELGPTTYQNRLRYQGRAQINLPGLAWDKRPLIALAWNELLMPLGGATQLVTLGQNRATVGVGLPVTPRQRVEIGYMNLYNAFPARRANEINHTLWLSWHYTGVAPSK
ncbi:DUF2490 domain-containing protein [Gemmatimonas sp.]|uniref:DUF2490 domain-containing protein n=1 Tax=Gemmatimonas sp. TaxID=1962908 RepID=UPI003566AD33